MREQTFHRLLRGIWVSIVLIGLAGVETVISDNGVEQPIDGGSVIVRKK